MKIILFFLLPILVLSCTSDTSGGGYYCKDVYECDDIIENLEAEIESVQENCEAEIEKLRSELEDLERDNDELSDRITELEDELEYYKNDGYEY